MSPTESKTGRGSLVRDNDATQCAESQLKAYKFWYASSVVASSWTPHPAVHAHPHSTPEGNPYKPPHAQSLVMTLIGLSIAIAWVSFFCYRHPPSSWPFLSLFRIRALTEGGQEDSVATVQILDADSKVEDVDKSDSKANLDRKAMPPPSIVARRSSATNTSAPRSTSREIMSRTASTAPTLATNNLPSISSFPAQNSIQRASGTCNPPRLNTVPNLEPPLRSTNLSATLRSKVPFPNRSPVAMTSSFLAIPPTHTTVPTKPSKKVLLSPGHSPLDWAHFSNSPNENLRGLPPSTPYLKVPPSLLRQYTGRKGKDAWTVLGGKVYNITSYMPYHPGGEPELMKAAGRDGTKLFGEVHPWVNWEGMLEPCLVGIAVAHEDVRIQNRLEEMD